MKKSFFKYIIPSVLLGFASCTDETVPLAVEQEVKELIITGKDFVEAYPQSRTSVDITEDGAIFEWCDNDTVGIFPEKGAQVFFLMQKNSGKTAVFTGGGWALKPSSSYGAYYPFIADFAIRRNTIPVDYSSQVQKGNASTEHLAKCDYMTAIPSSPVNGTVSMHFEHMGCLLHFNANALPSVQLQKVVLTTQEKDFPLKGILDIDKGQIIVDETSLSSEVTLMCEDVATSSNASKLTVNIMMPPFNLLGKKMYVNLYYADGSKNQIEVRGDNYQAGMSYNLTSEALSHEQVITIEHYGKSFTIPTFQGTNVIGKVYWGDYTEEDYAAGVAHDYADSEPNHSVTIGVKNVDKVKFNSIENISSIDFTKM